MAARARTKSARLERFLKRGFFPEELPPPFVSADLAKFRVSLCRVLDAQPNTRRGNPWYYDFISLPEVVPFPRHGKQDRRFTIINPVAFLYLAREISDSWRDIKAHMRKTSCSLSRPVFDWDGGRSLLKPDFAKRSAQLAKMTVEYPYILHMDISRFYHSVYTHSIPWALHTKTFAKRNRTMAHLGNRLDTLIRNAQDGQTIGLPVGPDTSRLVAELIGAALDAELCAADPRLKQAMVRFVDDISVGAQSREDAERLKNLIRNTINSFELETNEDKTSISPTTAIDYASWRHELKYYMPKTLSHVSKFESFFDKILSLTEAHPKENVPLYALKRARRLFIFAREWPAIENFLLILYRTYPSILPVLVEIFANRRLERNDISAEKAKHFVNSNISRLVQNRRTGELSWMLFLAKVLSLTINAKSIEGIFETDSSVNALLVCDLHSKGLISGSVNRMHWNSYLTADGLRSEMWLYAYEATVKGWSGVGDGFLTSDCVFKELHSKKVSFYDEKKNIQRYESRVAWERWNILKAQAAFSLNLEEVASDDEELAEYYRQEEEWQHYQYDSYN
jgi:hypothetical protein